MAGPRRAWRYEKDSWEPAHWWHKFLPQVFLGGSEWGQHTIVQRVPFLGWGVFAWWTCRCQDCKISRLLSMEDEVEASGLLDSHPSRDGNAEEE